MSSARWSIRNIARHRIPRVPFSVIKDVILGKRYTLSVAFVRRKTMKKLNRAYRGKNTSTDILAFPLGKNEGELVFSMPDVKRKSSLFGLTGREYLAYLLIHGLLHLKGLDHGRTMNALEKRYCLRFKVKYPSE